MPTQKYITFKAKTPLEERRRRLKEKQQAHPKCITIVLDSINQRRGCLGKSQIYIVNLNAPLQSVIRKLQEDLKIDRHEVLGIFSGKRFISWNTNIKEIYEKDKDPEDEYLYLTYGILECVS